MSFHHQHSGHLGRSFFPSLPHHLHQALKRLATFTSDIQLLTSHLAPYISLQQNHYLFTQQTVRYRRKPTIRSKNWGLRHPMPKKTAPSSDEPGQHHPLPSCSELPKRPISAPPFTPRQLPSVANALRDTGSTMPYVTRNVENSTINFPDAMATNREAETEHLPHVQSVPQAACFPYPSDCHQNKTADGRAGIFIGNLSFESNDLIADSSVSDCNTLNFSQSSNTTPPVLASDHQAFSPILAVHAETPDWIGREQPPDQISRSPPTAAHQTNQAPPPDQISWSPPTAAHQVDPPAVRANTPPPDQTDRSLPTAAHPHLLSTPAASRPGTPNPPITLDDVANDLATQAPAMTKKRKKKKQKNKSLPVVATESGVTSLHADLGLVKIDQCHVAPANSPQLSTPKRPIKYTSEQLACLSDYLLMRHPNYVLLSIDEQGVLLGKDINKDFCQQDTILFSHDGEFVFKRENGKILDHLSIFDY